RPRRRQGRLVGAGVAGGERAAVPHRAPARPAHPPQERRGVRLHGRGPGAGGRQASATAGDRGERRPQAVARPGPAALTAAQFTTEPEASAKEPVPFADASGSDTLSVVVVVQRTTCG